MSKYKVKVRVYSPWMRTKSHGPDDSLHVKYELVLQDPTKNKELVIQCGVCGDKISEGTLAQYERMAEELTDFLRAEYLGVTKMKELKTVIWEEDTNNEEKDFG